MILMWQAQAASHEEHLKELVAAQQVGISMFAMPSLPISIPSIVTSTGAAFPLTIVPFPLDKKFT